MKIKPSLIIGIPTYNAQNNIKTLISSLLSQEQKSFNLNKLIVYSDASNDKTIHEAKKIKNSKLRIIDAKTRKGFAQGVKELIRLSKTDLLLILNDDIKIDDDNFLEKIIKPYSFDSRVGLICGNPQPLKPKTFVEKALVSRLRASEKLSLMIKKGSNNFSCDGKTLLLSQKFINRLNLPTDNHLMGNVDAFLYFKCITQNFKYKFAKEAIVHYRTPSNLFDYINWISRNNSNKDLLKKTFTDKIVNREFHKPTPLLIYTLFLEFLKNPLGSIFIMLLELYISSISITKSIKFNSTWDSITTTKNLN